MSDDLISRQAAIDMLEERLQANGYSNVALVSELNRIIGYLKRLPSARPEITADRALTEEEIKNIKRMMANSPLVFIPSAQPETQWIPCSERLPELDQEVLVYAIGKVDGFGDSVIAMSKRHIFRLFSSSEEGVEVWTSPWPYFSSNYEITHWMPLPDPPKGEQE